VAVSPRTITNARGGVTTNTIDGMNRVIATSTPVTGPTPMTISTATAYDGNGNIIGTTDPRGVVREFIYDDLNRLTDVIIVSGPAAVGPVGTIARYSYEGATDLRRTETDISGNVTTYLYDGLLRLSNKLSDEPGVSEGFTHDLVGNVLTHTDANQSVTKTDYDGLNRTIRVTRDFGGPSEVFVETKYEESESSHVFKTEEYDSQKKLRIRYANDVAGRLRAKALLLEGAGSAAAKATTAAHPLEPATNASAAALFGPGLPAASVRYIETYDYEVGTSGGVDVSGAVGQTILEPSRAFDSGTPRSSRVGFDGLGREVFRTRGNRPAQVVKYDGLGGKKEVKDENGNITRRDYDSAGRLVTMTDADGKRASYKVDEAGNRKEETDRRGVIKSFDYDNLGRLVKTTVPGALTGNPWTETIDYLDASRQVRMTDARGSTTLTTNDRLGRPRFVTQHQTEFGGGNRTREITYDGLDKRTESDWQGRFTTYEYDGLHRLTKTIDPAPFAEQNVETVYDDANNRTVVKDRRGNRTVTQHDSLGRVVWVRRGACDANGEGPGCETQERNEYDGSSNRVLTADGRDHKTRFGYDDANRLVARVEGFEAAIPTETTVTRFELDNGGRVWKEFRGRLAATEAAVTYGYDPLNRVESEVNGESEETRFGYDEEGNRTTVKPPLHPATEYTYDELGKLTSVTLPETEDHGEAVTRFTYDPNRNKLTQTDARGNLTSYGYDRANRLTSMIEPGNLTTGYQLDANGNVLVRTDAKLQTETSTYDELNRKKTAVYALAPNTTSEAWREVRHASYEYDPNGNRLEAHEWVSSGADPPGGAEMVRSVVQVFDKLDRVETESTTLPDGPISKVVEYEYFPNGTRKALVLDGRRTAYEYDAQNRVKTTTTPDGVITTYAYFADDLLRETTTTNVLTAARTYDKAGRLKTLTNTAGATAVSSYAYDYDANGNRIGQVETLASVVGLPSVGNPVEATSYTYDAANRLKSVTYPADATYPNGRTVTYGYDKVGNREREVETTTAGEAMLQRAGVFDENNRLTSLTTTVAPPTVPPSYVPPTDVTAASVEAHVNSTLLIGHDPNGNEITRIRTVVDPVDGVSITLTRSIWDMKDRLVEQTRPVAEGDEGSGVEATGTIARHEYDADGRRTKKIGEDGVRQYVYDDTSILAEYDTNGLEVAKYDYGADRLIRLTRADEGTRYMSFDGLGSVTGLTDPAGAVTATLHLDVWGGFRFGSELATTHNRFGYTGHYWDKEASLYYAKARYYDPFTARFTQADSFLGNIDDPPSLHRYFYVHANPTRYTDSTGHFLDSAGQYLREVPKVAPLVVAVGEGVSAIGAATFAAAAAGITLIAGGGYLVVATVGAWEDAERAKLYDETQKTLVELGRIRADARRGIVITEDEDAGDRLQDLKRRDEARAQGAELGDIKPKKERRPKFRKATRDHAWEEAAPGPIDDTKSCPDCGKMLTGKKDPETGKVDFQLDHFEKSWAERSDELNKAKASRAERNDAYQEKVRVSCAPCNESKGGQFGAQRKAEKRDKVVVRPQAPQPTPMPREP
jgi:RHS repeat-associated protein